ncbi:hypothetical protein, partial [Pseudarthrobacter oxydans]|uniref:hypothetical protein n=1 Tax=Pseudarthrobacter oxydans TaxID=1671 RepID=UPI00381013DA
QLQIGYSLEKCRQDGGMTLIPGIHFPTNREEPSKTARSNLPSSVDGLWWRLAFLARSMISA